MSCPRLAVIIHQRFMLEETRINLNSKHQMPRVSALGPIGADAPIHPFSDSLCMDRLFTVCPRGVVGIYAWFFSLFSKQEACRCSNHIKRFTPPKPGIPAEVDNASAMLFYWWKMKMGGGRKEN
jgi:hypothetical protein